MSLAILSSRLRPLLERLSRDLPRRVILDHEGKSPYLTRFYLLGGARDEDSGARDVGNYPRAVALLRKLPVNLYLHRFHRSDEDDSPHNHPWRWAVALVLVGGYCEERPYDYVKNVRTGNLEPRIGVRVVWPLSLNIIRARDFHRVRLLEEDCWSLFLAGPKTGGWGFLDKTTSSVTPWSDYYRFGHPRRNGETPEECQARQARERIPHR